MLKKYLYLPLIFSCKDVCIWCNKLSHKSDDLMSKHHKLLKRLLSHPTDFEWSEAVTLLKSFDFEVIVGDGSRRKLRHKKTNQLIIIHVPHPQKEIKAYSVCDIIRTLKEGGFIK